ncbi:MAG: guanylate kinase [Eubacterium sp.]|nr:guanylate kinase [Eubacterium sp.]
MIILLGKSASGKDTIVRNLVEQHDYKRIITWTTRPMRPGEKEGVTYHYTTEEDFKKKINEGFFVEWKKYETVKGTWYYGTALDDIMKARNDDYSVIILTKDGLEKLNSFCSHLVGINLLSVYLDVDTKVIKQRLLKRGDDKKEAARRIKYDKKDFKGIENMVDVVIENNHRDIQEVVNMIHKMHVTYLDNLSRWMNEEV